MAVDFFPGLPSSAENPVGHFFETEPGQRTVRDHLEHVLASAAFKNSKRNSALLRYAVDRTLEGRTELLKERLLGSEVFGRAPDYDTSSDHVVRSTAGEIRKRLAQYYLEPGRESNLRIELLPGSYIPQFRLLKEETVAAAIFEQAVIPGTPGSRPRHRLPARLMWGVVLACLAAAGVSLALVRVRPGASDRFWGPLLETPFPVAICVGDPRRAWYGTEASAFAKRPAPAILGDLASAGQTAAQPASASHRWYYRNVPFGDAITLSRLTALFSEKKKDYRTIYSPDSTLADLRQNSAVLVGGIDNFWTMRLTRDWRYRFELDQAAGSLFIQDSQAPERRDWAVNLDLASEDVTVDYALVARVQHPDTGRLVVVAGGLRDCGTIAAGEFLTSASGLAELERRAPAGTKNVEAVLTTRVLKGSPGPPQLVAAYFW